MTTTIIGTNAAGFDFRVVTRANGSRKFVTYLHTEEQVAILLNKFAAFYKTRLVLSHGQCFDEKVSNEFKAIYFEGHIPDKEYDLFVRVSKVETSFCNHFCVKVWRY